MRLSPGVWITPVVRLVRPLGAGGMSTVWVAAHMRLHTQVAVKVLAMELRRDDNARARFRRESRLWSLIQSPHLVQTLDAGELEDGTPFMVMEWLEGETLSQRLERERNLSPYDTLAIVQQLGRALTSAHTAGVVHRDIKPANLFLLRSTSTPLLKVLDFGVAKRTAHATFNDTVAVRTLADEPLGTPHFMSPEQLRSPSEVDHATDLWAVAVVTYRLLLGVRPFDAEDFPALCFSILSGEFAVPTSFDPSWPAGLDGWFRRAFSLQPRSRFESAEHAVRELEQALAPLGPHRPRPAPAPADELDDGDEPQTRPR
ncbi:MAG: serine/threonine-protein kinase [Myxococcota bacterium]